MAELTLQALCPPSGSPSPTVTLFPRTLRDVLFARPLAVPCGLSWPLHPQTCTLASFSPGGEATPAHGFSSVSKRTF